MPHSAESAAPATDSVDAGADWVLTLENKGEAPPVLAGAGALARGAPLAVCFSGTLYNQRDLCAELRLGTDTPAPEVIRSAWARWGEATLSRINGIYVLAVHDADRRESLIARDPHGVYPAF